MSMDAARGCAERAVVGSIDLVTNPDDLYIDHQHDLAETRTVRSRACSAWLIARTEAMVSASLRLHVARTMFTFLER